MTRLRITVSCLMMIIAVAAVDLAVLPFLRGPGNRALFGAMPMADVLAVLLATIVGRLRRRGEAPLSHVMFLLAGGMALVFLVYLVQLRPDLVYEYVLNTVGRRGGGQSPGQSSPGLARGECADPRSCTVCGLGHTRLSAEVNDLNRRSERGREARLIENQVTDAGLKDLTGLKSLQTLKVRNNKVAHAGLKDLDSPLLSHEPSKAFPIAKAERKLFAERMVRNAGELRSDWWMCSGRTRMPLAFSSFSVAGSIGTANCFSSVAPITRFPLMP